MKITTHEMCAYIKKISKKDVILHKKLPIPHVEYQKKKKKKEVDFRANNQRKKKRERTKTKETYLRPMRVLRMHDKG